VGLSAVVLPLLSGFGAGLGFYGAFADRYGLRRPGARATMEHVQAALLSAGLATVAVVSVLVGVTWWTRRRGDTRAIGEILTLWCRRFAFLAVLPLGVALGAPVEHRYAGLVLTFAVIIGVVTAFSAYHWMSERPRSETPAWQARLSGAVLGAMVAAYALGFSHLTIANHRSFNTGRADLGIYVSIFRHSSRGHFLGCSLCGDGVHYTGGHFDPILVLLSPLYLLYPFAETLLVLQSVWLALGAIPVYLLGRLHLGHRGASLALAAAYLLYPALHGVNGFDFHSLALGIPLILWLVYFLEGGRARAYTVVLILLLLVREDMPLALAGVGVYAVFSRLPHGPRFGWVTLIVATVSFLLIKGVVMGRPDPLNTVGGASGYSHYFTGLAPPGTSTRGLIGTLLSDPVFVLSTVLVPVKMTYVAQLLAPLLLIPVLGHGKVMLSYGAALTMLATRAHVASIHFHYSATLVPFLFVLTISGLARIRELGGATFARKGVPALALGIFVTTLLCSWKFGALVPNRSFRGGFRSLERQVLPSNAERAAWLRELSRELPKEARVAANSHLVTHLGSTLYTFMLPRRFDADYVVLGPLGSRHRALQAEIEKEIHAGYLEPFKQADRVRVFRTKYPKRLVEKARRGKGKARPPRNPKTKRQRGEVRKKPPEDNALEAEP
jgi:uncharacterized membrane protein